MHTTIWKFERKNSQENHHMVWNGATTAQSKREYYHGILGNAKVVGSNPVQSQKIFSGHFSNSVIPALASFILTFSIYNI